MKKLRQIAKDIQELQGENSKALQDALWNLICYSPKIPNRLHQQNLADKAEKITLQVQDRYFTNGTLDFNCFKWSVSSDFGATTASTSPIKVLLTHGWGSKGTDFVEFITALTANENFEIWAFDAPGNGSSESELSNLFLYAEAVKQVWDTMGGAHIMIGHSLGGMANALAIQQTRNYPQLLINIAPLINLKDNFIASMDAVNTSKEAQATFFEDFEKLFGQQTDSFVLNKIYDYPDQLKHLLIYEANDLISPNSYIETFLQENPGVIYSRYEDTSHSKILTDPRVISETLAFINKELSF